MNTTPETTPSATGPQPESEQPAAAGGTQPLTPNWLDAGLLLAVFVAAVWGLGRYGLYEPHEGHFAGVAREMVTRGDWLTPHLNGAPYLNKPPLLYWMIALSYTAFGFSEWAARLPLALISVCGAALAWQWARELWGLRAGRMAAAVLSVAFGWYLFSHQLLIDLLLATLNMLSLYLLWRAVQTPERRGRWAAFYAVIGLMVMAKGLIGLFFPLVAFLLFALWRRNWGILRRSRPLQGLLIILAIAGPWVALIEWHNPGTLHYMLVNEQLKRMAGTRWPPDYTVVNVSIAAYIGVTLIWLMPWALLLPQVVSFVREEGRQGSASPSRDAVLLLALGALLPVAFFVPVPSRLIYYSLPTLAPFALLVAGWWAASDRWPRGRLAAGVMYSLLGMAIAMGSVTLPSLLRDIPQLAAVPELPPFVVGLAMLIGVALWAGGAMLMMRQASWALAAMFVILAAAEMHTATGFAAYQNTISSKTLVTELRNAAGPECVWISEGSKELGAAAGIGFYLGQDANGGARTVLVMEDDPRRPPPAFPGAEPAYRTTQDELAEIWASGRPALFVTDVMRTDWQRDEPQLPPGEKHLVPLKCITRRRVYANAAAWERLRGTVFPYEDHSRNSKRGRDLTGRDDDVD
jgi:4-amino-4-deoxy-L-arabinose transferase-like glycosyltransferase